MAIKSIRVSNFKSFRDLQVELGPFNVLIGANASGKSNFVQVFRFLRDIANEGLRNAISMQGGIGYLRNVSIGSSKHLSVGVASDDRVGFVTRKAKGWIDVAASERVYEFSISFGKSEGQFEILEDKLTVRLELAELEPKGERMEEVGQIGPGEVTVSNVGGTFEYDSSLPEGGFIEQSDIFHPFIEPGTPLPPWSLLVERPLFALRFGRPGAFLSDVSVYDFDPKLPKKAIPITGRAELEEDGNNLAIVLRSILEDEEKRRKFLNLLKDVLGFVDGLRVMPLADRSLLFALQETYTQEHPLPASFLSDGTIHVIALIIALYFDEKSLVIIEEPERNIHPFLIARVVDMLKEASEKKQIIVTTHNPEVVKHAGVENLLLVSRDEEGFSTITKPRDSEQVVVFLKNEIGIEDLFVQDLLGA